MKTIFKISLYVVSILAITSCSLHNSRTAVGSGPVETMEVEVADFTGVTITGTCEVEIFTGETQRVELSAQTQILNVMTYVVKDGILHIGFHPDYNVKTHEEISADIVVSALDFISITGAGDFEISGDTQPALDIHITGTGDVDALDMVVDDCSININGAGNCEVNVAESLDIRVSGVGNVHYMGNPSITQDISGVGNVIPLGN